MSMISLIHSPLFLGGCCLFMKGGGSLWLVVMLMSTAYMTIMGRGWHKESVSQRGGGGMAE